MNKTIYEQLEDVAKTPGRVDIKAKKLAQYKSQAMMIILNLALNPKISFDLVKPIKYNFSRDQKSALPYRLKQEAKKLEKLCSAGEYAGLDVKKRTNILVDILETIDPDDAKMVVELTDGKLPFPQINQRLVLKAFPELAPLWGVELPDEKEEKDD